MLHRDRADIALLVNIQNRIFVQIASFRGGFFAPFNQRRVGILKITNSHGTNLLLKKASRAGLSILKKDNAKIPVLHAGNLNPALQPAVLLPLSPEQRCDCLLDPFISNYRAIWPRPDSIEVRSLFHPENLTGCRPYIEPQCRGSIS